IVDQQLSASDGKSRNDDSASTIRSGCYDFGEPVLWVCMIVQPVSIGRFNKQIISVALLSRIVQDRLVVAAEIAREDYFDWRNVRLGYPNLNETRSQYVAGGKKSRADELVQLNGFFIGNLSKLLEGSVRVFFRVQRFRWFVFQVALSI